MNLIKSSLKYRQVTLSILAIVFALGVYSLVTMPRREDPKLTVPQGLVIAYYPGASSLQVEEQVTKKIEQCLFQNEEVCKIKTYSTSMDGVSVVSVWLNDNVKKPEIFWSNLRHQLLVIKNIDLPKGVLGPVVNSDFGDTEAMLVSIESDQASNNELTAYAKILESKIRTIDATSKIKRLGEQKEQINISYDPTKLSLYKISLQNVVNILQAQNNVTATGDINTSEENIGLYNTSLYNNIDDLSNQIIGTSPAGNIIRIRDIASLNRGVSEAKTNITVNGKNAVIVSIQMNEGNNIVKFGKEVNKAISEVSEQLPSNVHMTTIVNQPKMVDKNVSHFLMEFMIAIISVIIVVLLLLPFRVAAVSATAIPITVSMTFALMHIFGIELHQVSLASLIVVLGMVVDDAIVVTDNYIDLLDKGIDRWTAAWRSASDLVVPILTATITIIASFMPMIILTGAIGEFVHDLPITVSIALASSFFVAMVLTPLLCYFFIKKGIHNSKGNNVEEKKSFILTMMQKAYNKAIDWSVNHPAFIISISIVLVILTGVIFKTSIRQRFMPFAERNQFVVELWMPTGTNLIETQKSIRLIENEIKDEPRVMSYATFTGTSAPRIYYNFAPEFPVSNYAQILINTTSNENTETLARDLTAKVDHLVPNGMVHVKLMQQGQPMTAPLEVRITGDDIAKLKGIGSEIENIIKSKKGHHFVYNDFREDYYGINIQLTAEASRTGYTASGISQLVYTAYHGYPVTSICEGDRVIDVVLQMEKNLRDSNNNLENLYVESTLSGASLPLRQIATFVPSWQAGRIVHRNGVRTLTVRSETIGNVLPSELLSQVKPEIDKIPLPTGYSISYGGEFANKNEVISHLMIALLISLIGIFLILLFQFKNVKETLIIMITIPLSLFGVVIGLLVTGNFFGLTAFMGIISLSGIIVRNSIILIDHTNELIKSGYDIREAAIEAGKRRMRPVFLTAMAAAVGVMPMIISGSSLWSPLASVLAFGVTWSMIMSLLTVPVLYIKIIRARDKKQIIKSYSNNN